MVECSRQEQRLAFAGVNAHHKNYISKIMISSLSEISISMMIRAKKRCPSAISKNICPYDLKIATEAF